MSRVDVRMPDMRIPGCTLNGVRHMSVDGICKWLADVEDAFREAEAHEYAIDTVGVIRKQISNSVSVDV